MISLKLLHVLSWVPLFVMALVTFVLGLYFIGNPPWVQDDGISRFFGLWMLGLGGMICGYLVITLMGTRRARNTLLSVLGIFMGLLFYLEYRFIPDSPFITLTWVLFILYLVSLWATVKLNRGDRNIGA
ncbi:MAG: hypothetical protein ACE5HZ_00590 [Fidelibacterota bacterium]